MIKRTTIFVAGCALISLASYAAWPQDKGGPKPSTQAQDKKRAYEAGTVFRAGRPGTSCA